MYYASTSQLYGTFKKLFEHVQKENPQALQSIAREKLIIRFKLAGPNAEMTVNGRLPQLQVTFGPSPLRADLEAELTADTLHGLLLHTLSIKKTFGNGEIKIKGPIWKMTSLIDVIEAGRLYYPAVIAEKKK